MLEKVWDAIVAVVVGIIVWFGSQALVGFTIGFISAHNSWPMDFSTRLAIIVGLIVSIISEIIYIKGKIDA